MIDLYEAFEQVNDDFLKFDRVEQKLSPRPDVCAFLLLDRLVPPEDGQDMICSATHDEYFLETDCERLAEVATLEDIRTLSRCGIRYDSEFECLAVFA
jgi:hypothetical protein